MAAVQLSAVSNGKIEWHKPARGCAICRSGLCSPCNGRQAGWRVARLAMIAFAGF